jgi:hypothetical protein
MADLQPRRSDRRSDAAAPMGEALVWASRIMAIGLAMFLPGVIGGWIDSRLGLWVCGPTGFVLGLAAALAWLVRIGKRPGEPR